MKKKTVLLALMLAGVMGLSGCKTWDVVCDILAVGTTKVEKDDGPKVDLEGETPEVKDDDSTDLETADSKTTSGNDEKEKDTKKNTTKDSDKTDKKRASYYNYYTNKKWGEAASYELCLNSSELGVQGTAKAIEQYILLKESIGKEARNIV